MGFWRSWLVAAVLAGSGSWGSAQQAPPAGPAVSQYDPALFLKPLAPDQMAFLKSYDGAEARDLWRDKQFKKLLKAIVPDCMFHYGRDMPLDDALDMVMRGSQTAVEIRNGRYLLMAGDRGPYLAGRGFVWIDLQEGIGLGGFFFRPVNGEPMPTLAVFSRQVKEEQLAMSDLPPEFAADLVRWSFEEHVPTVLTRYFLTGTNKRVLLEHDEDYCHPVDGSVPGPGNSCQQLNADAADADETAAYYLKQVNYRTNATAWMVGPDQVAWIGVRDRTCLGVPDALGCRIRVTREHTRMIVGPRGPWRRR